MDSSKISSIPCTLNNIWKSSLVQSLTFFNHEHCLYPMPCLPSILPSIINSRKAYAKCRQFFLLNNISSWLVTRSVQVILRITPTSQKPLIYSKSWLNLIWSWGFCHLVRIPGSVLSNLDLGLLKSGFRSFPIQQPKYPNVCTFDIGIFMAKSWFGFRLITMVLVLFLLICRPIPTRYFIDRSLWRPSRRNYDCVICIP